MAWGTGENKMREKINLPHKGKVNSPAKSIPCIWLPSLGYRERYLSDTAENDNIALIQVKEQMSQGVAPLTVESHLLMILFLPPTGPWRNPQPSGWMLIMKPDAECQPWHACQAHLWRGFSECALPCLPVSTMDVPECARTVNAKCTR